MLGEKVPWTTIQKITGRSPDTIRAIIKSKAGKVAEGAPTKDEFKARLRRTAMRLPTSLVKAAVGSVKRRFATISELKGGPFIE